MSKGALALLIRGGTENWSGERWKQRFDEVCRDRRVAAAPEAKIDPRKLITQRSGSRRRESLRHFQI